MKGSKSLPGPISRLRLSNILCPTYLTKTIKAFNTKVSILIFLTLEAVTVAITAEDPTAFALYSQVGKIAGQVHGVEDQETATNLSQCIEAILCCGFLATALNPTLDPILLGLGINGAQKDNSLV